MLIVMVKSFVLGLDGLCRGMIGIGLITVAELVGVLVVALIIAGLVLRRKGVIGFTLEDGE
jgi:hypothetical protein